MTNKELSQAIRNELKEHGYNAKTVSVSVRDCGYSTSVHVKIKSPEISRKDIKKIVNHREEYERDARTYEILKGGNTYIFVDYEYGIFDEVAREWESTALSLMQSKDETTHIFNGLYLLNIDRTGRIEIRQQDDNEHCTFHVGGLTELCVFLYKFATFGSIAV